MLTTTDPRVGVQIPTDIALTSSEEVAEICNRASAASKWLTGAGREGRAELLEAIAQEIEAAREILIAITDAETGLGEARLNGEISRSAFQFRLFAEAIREGSYVEAAIDYAEETPLGPQPDVRRMLVSVGPVAVFGSSNFPFAFSVLGGDVASAIAAGSPVVAKAHSSHPLTSRASYEAILRATASVGAPAGVIGIVYGQDAGTSLVKHPDIMAVGFTGSVPAADALKTAIRGRDIPVPFYGELSSINPLIITAAAAAARTDAIAQGLFASVSGSGGQLCTKPGIAYIPEGEDGDALVTKLAELAESAAPSALLNNRIWSSFYAIQENLKSNGAQAVTTASVTEGTGFYATPTVLTVDVAALQGVLTEECFGPLVLVARYRNTVEVIDSVRQLPGTLTVTLHAEESEVETSALVFNELLARTGRLLFNGFPTGVRVSWAQTHGGPWPATDNQFTSVGVSSIRRWLRPVTWQGVPQQILPEELRDGECSVPRRVDGELQLPTR